jgi:hypothetical protein
MFSLKGSTGEKYDVNLPLPLPFMRRTRYAVEGVQATGEQKAFMEKELLPYLDAVEKKQDGTIRETDLKKIKQYYGLAVPALLAEGYAALRGTPLTGKERNAATYLGATTGLFDDFFEDTQLQDNYITQLYRQPDTYTGQNDNERLANHCWGKALEGCHSKDLLIHYAGKVHAAQIASRLQTTTQPDTQTLQQITFDKGGYSVLFYMALFYENFPAEDETLFYNAGALLQLENDVFDVYKDDRMAFVPLPPTRIAYSNLPTPILHFGNRCSNPYPLPGTAGREKKLLKKCWPPL